MEKSWEECLDTATGRRYLSCRTTHESFFTSASEAAALGWTRYQDSTIGGNGHWWWHEATGRYFADPGRHSMSPLSPRFNEGDDVKLCRSHGTCHTMAVKVKEFEKTAVNVESFKSWAEVVEAQLSDHVPHLFVITSGNNRLCILSWNILMQCAVRKFGPNNGFNLTEKDDQYQARIQLLAPALADYFASPDLAGIAALQECPPHPRQQEAFVTMLSSLSGCALNFSSLPIARNQANLTVWDTARWKLIESSPMLQQGPLARALPAVLEKVGPGWPTRLGLLNVHLAWVAEAGTDAYVNHCSSVSQQVIATLQSLDKSIRDGTSNQMGSIVAALGDCNLDVADLAGEGLIAARLEGSSQSWQKGAPRLENVDGALCLV